MTDFDISHDGNFDFNTIAIFPFSKIDWQLFSLAKAVLFAKRQIIYPEKYKYTGNFKTFDVMELSRLRFNFTSHGAIKHDSNSSTNSK